VVKKRKERGRNKPLKQDRNRGEVNSVRRALWLFDEKRKEGLLEEGHGIPNCVNLLQAMELNEPEEDGEAQSRDENEDELMLLPEEWTYS
jgi:hypothetical protein